jgi:hypothetical protein
MWSVSKHSKLLGDVNELSSVNFLIVYRLESLEFHILSATHMVLTTRIDVCSGKQTTVTLMFDLVEPRNLVYKAKSEVGARFSCYQ